MNTVIEPDIQRAMKQDYHKKVALAHGDPTAIALLASVNSQFVLGAITIKAALCKDKKLDRTKMLHSSVEFYRYDDGWLWAMA